ncbi:hypothetical protein DACRYDRAFT_113170 [Dacryopinax primogenitus]|uniref:Chromatin target of PRMT1 protein C-terminal domain-containing protein n=1 Tax=Dacryopinax primogenitus (strain DJM 731) TaxID=1858805 RepID=M5GBU7_DACPD|nr:uncharacterized protein DACRYDRAFT_113170 [Dacryopinax primogenitus]EJU06469.1 hypothetical protein DACRYDRAFT_113170 [Dacryopinax primogenitus]
MYDDEEANVMLPYDDPTSPVPVTDEMVKEADALEGIGSLRDRLAPPTKVYRVENSKTIRGNLGKLKGISGGEEPEPEEDEMDLELGHRPNALLLQGEPIAHLPTDQVFAYVATYAPTPTGLEWVDDTTCVVLFSSGTVARGAHRFLLVDPPAEGEAFSDPLELQKAQPVPKAAWPEKARAEGAEEIRAALRGVVFVRQAKIADIKQRGARGQSRFYSTYGTQAGKEGYGRKRRREEEDEGEMSAEKRRALDEELDAYLRDESSEKQKRKKAEMDDQLDAYLAGDDAGLVNGHRGENGEYRQGRRMPRPRRERESTREDQAARRQHALDAQLDAYNEVDDVDTIPSKMRSDWTEEARAREFSPERRGGLGGRRSREEKRYEDAPVAMPMREEERRGKNEELEEEEGGGRRRRGRRGGRGPREMRNGDVPQRSNGRPRKELSELDAELEAYLNNTI